METEKNKSLSFIDNVKPELKKAIIEIAETIKPLLDAIHEEHPISKNYYLEYLELLSNFPNQKKLIALAMLYSGANANGLNSALQLV